MAGKTGAVIEPEEMGSDGERGLKVKEGLETRPVVCHGVSHLCRAKPSAFFRGAEGSSISSSQESTSRASASSVEEEVYLCGGVGGGDEGGLELAGREPDSVFQHGAVELAEGVRV